ncbi:flagellar filament capping protein FliD [Alkaliphilus pronyensis]|uniref:Flagellar hook-associated protein 2 n=1 Tax=Alkaliphilus pronyensis TaxID=1482732 RepID=A0A6I0FNL2_9FIRM|nr:flagellar filament capping protein FliD [Alkaliphilus pronyensis]KAB3539653.1 flagellar filament capping protein FliD [Alkaliphilus pronyensis]
MRIGGIASGMDTEHIVKQLMDAERMRVNRFIRQEQTLKWRMEEYNNLNKSMANFILNTRNEFGLNEFSTNGTIRSSSTNSFTWAKEATSANESIVTASARSNAMNGSYTVEVTSTASVAKTTSKVLKGNVDPLDDVLDVDNNFIADGSFTITTDVGSSEITVTAGDSIGSLISKLNNAVAVGGPNDGQSLGIRASYDSDLGQFMMSTRETGEHKSIQITDDPVGLAAAMFSGDIMGPGENGTDAVINFNSSEIRKSTNSFSVFGIDLQLKNAAVGEVVTINVSTNTDGIYDKIKSFVDEYNGLLDEINGKIGEKEYRDFYPLIQEEKDAMTEKEIELWEEKAKSGLLKNNEVLQRTLSGIRGALYEKVEGVTGSFEYIYDIGITTGYYKDGGKLVIDEDKLKDAINSDPDGVLDLFFKAPEVSATGEDRMKESGLIQRTYDGLVAGMKEVIRHSGPGDDSSLYRSVQSNMLVDFVTKQSNISDIGRSISQLNSRIAREEVLLASKEDRYWNQFTAMEKAMAEMQQQSNWLMSQMGLGA